LVLGAGAFTGGSFEAGVLAALQEHGGWDAREADLIVGTSIGSIVGATLRCGLSPQDIYRYQVDEELSSHGRSFFAKLSEAPDDQATWRFPRMSRPPMSLLLRALRNPWRSRAALLTAAIPTGRISMQPMAATLGRLTGTDWPSNTLWTVASKLPFGERVVFGVEGCPETEMPLAVAASCAVPGMFEPVHIGDARYVDGGVHSPTNADLVVGQGFDTVYVVSPMSTGKVRARPNPLRMYCRAVLGAEVRKLRREGVEVRVFQPDLAVQRAMGFNAFDETRAARVARVSYQVAAERLAGRVKRLAA
jgi:NTE family protein